MAQRGARVSGRPASGELSAARRRMLTTGMDHDQIAAVFILVYPGLRVRAAYRYAGSRRLMGTKRLPELTRAFSASRANPANLRYSGCHSASSSAVLVVRHVTCIGNSVTVHVGPACLGKTTP